MINNSVTTTKKVDSKKIISKAIRQYSFIKDIFMEIAYNTENFIEDFNLNDILDSLYNDETVGIETTELSSKDLKTIDDVISSIPGVISSKSEDKKTIIYTFTFNTFIQDKIVLSKMNDMKVKGLQDILSLVNQITNIKNRERDINTVLSYIDNLKIK